MAERSITRNDPRFVTSRDEAAERARFEARLSGVEIGRWLGDSEAEFRAALLDELRHLSTSEEEARSALERLELTRRSVLYVIRFTHGPRGYGLLEERAVGEARLYSEGGQPLPRLPGDAWEVVREVGSYREGDREAFRCLFVEALGPAPEGWKETAFGVSIFFELRDALGVVSYPQRLGVTGASRGVDEALRRGLEAWGYRLRASPAVLSWESGAGGERIAHLLPPDTEPVAPLLARYYVEWEEAGGEQHILALDGLYYALYEVEARAGGSAEPGDKITISVAPSDRELEGAPGFTSM